jgi:hypothetical protein
MSVSLAVAELQRCAGSHFDRHVVDALVGVVGNEVEPVRVVPLEAPQLASGELAGKPAVLVGSAGAGSSPVLGSSAG